MAFDFEKLTFDSSNFEVLPAQVVAEIHEMQPNDIYYFDVDDIWVDHENKVWVDGNCQVFTLDEVKEEGDEFDINFARIIMINQGLIVDASHFDKHEYTLDNRFVRNGLEKMKKHHPDLLPLPVIYLASNKGELDLIEEPLASKYNLILEGTELDGVVGSYVGASSEDDDEWDDGDDED